MSAHGDLGMIIAGDEMLVLSWSGETVELRSLIDDLRPLLHHADRGHGQRREYARQSRRHRAGAAGGAWKPVRTI